MKKELLKAWIDKYILGRKSPSALFGSNGKYSYKYDYLRSKRMNMKRGK